MCFPHSFVLRVSVSGTYVASSDIDFFLDVDPATGDEMVIVSDTVHTRHHAEFLSRHICKFEDIIASLEGAGGAAVAVAPPAPSGQRAF